MLVKPTGARQHVSPSLHHSWCLVTEAHVLAGSDQELKQFAKQCEEAATDGMQDSRIGVKSSEHLSPDNAHFRQVKQDNCSFQSCQQYVGIISEANIAYWLRYLGCCMPVV